MLGYTNVTYLVVGTESTEIKFEVAEKQFTDEKQYYACREIQWWVAIVYS